MTDTPTSEENGSIADPRLSVVIPHLNHPGPLARCLRSLADQQISGEVEVIVVDNGSTTLPHDVVDTFPAARLMSEPTPGPGPARSAGAHTARADVLAFIDADCVAEPGWAQAILDTFAARPDVAVIGGDVRILPDDPDHLTGLEAYESVWGYRNRMYVEKQGYTGTGNMAVRRPTFLTVGDFGGIETAEDYDWGQRARAVGVQTVYVPEMIIATPARATMDELRRKWDRHLHHDLTGLNSGKAKVRYAIRAAAMAVSPVAETVRIARSDRITGLGTRLRALRCLVAIRWYRARKMIANLRNGATGSASASWRAEAPHA